MASGARTSPEFAQTMIPFVLWSKEKHGEGEKRAANLARGSEGVEAAQPRFGGSGLRRVFSGPLCERKSGRESAASTYGLLTTNRRQGSG